MNWFNGARWRLSLSHCLEGLLIQIPSHDIAVGDSCVVVIDLCPTTQSNGKERSIPIEDRKGNITYLAKELAKAGMEIADEAGVEYVSVRVVNPEAWVKGYGEGVMTHHRFLGFGLPIVLGDVPPYQRQ